MRAVRVVIEERFEDAPKNGRDGNRKEWSGRTERAVNGLLLVLLVWSVCRCVCRLIEVFS